MPIYEYECQNCGRVYAHLWRSIQQAARQRPPACPACGGEETQRVVSQVAVLGGLGGLTPAEHKAENAQQARLASITPKEQIDKLRAGKQKPGS